MKFYKIRVFILLSIIRFLSRIFAVEFPPIVSVAAFIEKEGKMLFLNLSYLKGYGLPGGIVNKQEDIEGALKREVFEETGLIVIENQYLWSIPSSAKGVPTLSLFFKVKTEGELKESKEGTLCWLHINDVRGKLAYDSVRLGLEKYVNSGYK